MPTFNATPPQNKLILVVNSLLLIGLAYLIASLGWKLIPIDPALLTSTTQTSETFTPIKDKVSPQAQTERINKALLFGSIAVVETPVPTPKIAPVTPLNLTIKGIFASSGSPHAIISSNNREDNVYTLNDVLPGNAKLIEIYFDRVILLRNGQKEALYLPKDQLPAGSSLNHSQSNLPTPYVANNEKNSLRTPSNYRLPPTPSPKPRGNASFSRFSNNNAAPIDATEIREAFMNNPASLLDYGRVAPARQGGRQIGYRVYEGQLQGRLAQYGIQAGDIITSVNNIPLNGSQSIGQLMSVVSRSNSARVELLRNGTPMTKNFQLR